MPGQQARLQEDIEDVGVRLLNLIQQDDRKGAAPDGLRELAALIVAQVARRRPNQLGHSVPLHVLAHVQADHGGPVPKVLLRQHLHSRGIIVSSSLTAASSISLAPPSRRLGRQGHCRG